MRMCAFVLKVNLMNRDVNIQRVFEIADDSLQGVIGYHLYVGAIQKAVEIDKVQEYLPAESIHITFSWVRYYRKQDLIDAFAGPYFELLQSRISLISMVNVFEVALSNFILHLRRKGIRQFQKKSGGRLSYKDHLKWAYKQSLKCDIGDKGAIGRLPMTFGIIDNARRLRNLIVHNHGLFSDYYERDVIDSYGVIADFHPHYEVYKANQKRPTPVIIDSGYFHRLIQAHIEVLHVLHNSIQKEYFGVSKGYSYAEERKPIDWRRVLWGEAKVQVQLSEKTPRETGI